MISKSPGKVELWQSSEGVSMLKRCKAVQSIVFDLECIFMDFQHRLPKATNISDNPRPTSDSRPPGANAQFV
ncbi:Hypothetical protein NTJ_10036 [Nesidiocoris tenuis]|uniref:Uncharacterized protein n=1 Tax=Nesidiocoris tenuis TaxID=355587 RepID=A0ABN7B3A1_9HEMI|nr:Hypothetical protein NTJ_10036 [Nesidiocoris tenuis]